jgi:hypothetical protein
VINARGAHRWDSAAGMVVEGEPRMWSDNDVIVIAYLTELWILE